MEAHAYTHHCPSRESPDSIGWFASVALSFITSEYESGFEMQVIAGPKPSGSWSFSAATAVLEAVGLKMRARRFECPSHGTCRE